MEEKKKKLNLKIVIPVVIAILVIVAVIFILSMTTKVFWSYRDYINNGEFEKAYTKAKNEEEKEIVIKTNAIAYVSLLAVNTGDNKDITTYSTLIDAWYDNNKNIVVCLRSMLSSSNHYLYFAYSESKKDYDFVCISKDPITIDNITLADSYTNGVKNSSYSSAIQEIAINTMKQKLPDKLSSIMTNENKVSEATSMPLFLDGYITETELLKINK